MLPLLAALCLPAQARPDLPYRELTGKATEFRHVREWRSYYWREDFTFVLKTDDGKSVRVISREPTPWTDLRLGTTFTGLKVDWAKEPRVRVIGVGGIDRIPAEFPGLKLDGPSTATAFIVRVSMRPGVWADYFINNWFHPWGKEAGRKMLAHFAAGGTAYTVYGFLNTIAAPLDAAGQAVVKKYEADYGGIIYHARVARADTPAGYELKLLHLMGRHKKSLDYRVFHGDPKTLIKLDGTPPPKDKPKEKAKRFSDASAASGLRVARDCHPHGVGVADLDGDGKPDILIVTFDAPHVYLFRNKGGLVFEDITKGSGLEAFKGAGAGVAIADYDGDGKPDVYITSVRGAPSRLFRNLGGGKFADVSVKSGTLIEDAARSCAWSDVDGDGRPDLFVCCPDKGNRLFRNNGGTFTEIAAKAGVALKGRHCLGCAFGDYDGSGRDGLFVTCYKSQQSALFKNLGGGKFSDVTADAGLARKASAVGCVFADVFNKGRLDLLVTTDSWLSGANSTEAQLLAMKHTVEPNVLYANDGKGKFTPSADKALAIKSLAHDAVIEDFNHDGRPEIYCTVDADSANQWATSKGGDRLWTRRGDDSWTEVAAAWGIKHEANSVCVVAADFDGDGDLDLLLVNFYSPPVLLRNNTDDGNWLIVRAPLGSKVRVGGATRHIQAGSGYARCSPPEAHFGLGPIPATEYDVDVSLPGGKKVSERRVKPGRVVVVKRLD